MAGVNLHPTPLAVRRFVPLRWLSTLTGAVALLSWALLLLMAGTGRAQAEALAGDWAAQATAAAQQAAAQAHPGLRVQVTVGELDQRLRLAPCQRIEPQLPAGARPWGHLKLALRCVDGPVRWQAWLPLQVAVYARRPVAVQALAAGTVIEPRHLAEAEVDLAATAVAPLPAAALTGRTLARALPAGAALRPADLRQRQWFSAGDPVRVVAQGGGFAISTDAVALTAGLEGLPSRVRTESGRVLQGRAVAERRMEVDL